MQAPVLTFLLAFILETVSGAVLAIDYGTEWTKAALVKPGIPLDIVLTKDTKRKEQSVIAFKGKERLYGTDAANYAARGPGATFFSLKTLLGQSIDSDAAKSYAEQFPAVKMISQNDTIAFEVLDSTFTVLELVAMQLTNIKKNAELMADEIISDLVLNVPSYFDQAQRMALLDAARLANFRPLTLLNTGASIALDYVKSRAFETVQHHVVYDMGAGAASATLIRVSNTTLRVTEKINKTISSVEVLASSHDLVACGDSMTNSIFHFLLNGFHSQFAQHDLNSNHRAIARLRREANRVKQVLSANTEASAAVESLHEDIDFRLKVTRADYEEATKDIAEHVTLPIRRVLTQSGLDVDSIDGLILHGGATRVPFVQKQLKDLMSDHKILRNINADEASVMGAVFRGAALSGSFRVKEINFKDIIYQSAKLKTELDVIETLPRGTLLGTQVNVTVPHATDDMLLKMEQELDDDAARTSTYLRIQGINNATKALNTRGCIEADLKLQFGVDTSSILRGSNAYLSCEVGEAPGVADKVKGWFGAKPSAPAVNESDSSAPASTSEGRSSHSEFELVTIELGPGLGEMTDTQLEVSQSKIKILDQLDLERVALETARNALESYIYKIRDLLENSAFLEVSLVSEHDNLRSSAAAANEWLSENGDTASLTDFVGQQHILSQLTKPIHIRRDELGTRPEKVEALERQISTTRSFIRSQRDSLNEFSRKKEAFEKVKPVISSTSTDSTSSATENEQEESTSTSTNESTTDAKVEDQKSDDSSDTTTKVSGTNETEPVKPQPPLPPMYTEKDLETLEEQLNTIEEWFQSRKAQQDTLAITDDPVLRVHELQERHTLLSDSFMKLLAKASYRQQTRTRAKQSTKAKRPKKTKIPKPAASATANKGEGSSSDKSTTTATAESASSPAAEEASKDSDASQSDEQVVQDHEQAPSDEQEQVKDEL